MKRLFIIGLFIASPVMAQDRIVTVGLFANATDAAPVTFGTAPLSCGPVVFGGMVGVQRPGEDDLCYVDAAALIARVPPGEYRIAVERPELPGWGDRSLPFTVPAPKTCTDGAVTYALGDGPAVERYANDTIAKRATWIARERALVNAGFDVKTLLVSTSVYFAVTCR